MKDFYFTLCHELRGYCVRAQAPSEKLLTLKLNKIYGGLWTRIATEPPAGTIIIGEVFRVEAYEEEALREYFRSKTA